VATERAAAGHVPELDGLRAISVAAVAYSHWLPAWQFGLPLGAGVHLFFVLSGFLITRILLDARQATDRRAAVARFFVRRVLRLFPAFYVVLALAWVAGVPLARSTWPWHAGYLSNVFIAWQGTWQGHFSHFWSLAVEQQFYLAWPWFIVWAPARWLGPGLWAAVLAGPLARGAAAWNGRDEPFWALVPGGSADSLGVGALMAWAAWRGDPRQPAIWRVAALSGVAGWVGMAAVEHAGWRLPVALAVWRQLLQAAIFGAIVWHAVRGVGGMPGRVLAHPITVGVGRISYGVYLVQPFAPLVLAAVVSQLGGADVFSWPAALRAAAAWAASLGLAGLLWVLVERPAQRLKARRPVA
jgi:peptidoglycan/LPS O-acetylase OafA/YrhL